MSSGTHKSKQVIGILFCLAILISLIYLVYNPVLIVANTRSVQSIAKHKKGDTVQVFKNFDFNNGKWEAYIRIYRSDSYDLPQKLRNGKLFWTNDVQLLNEMKERLFFNYTSSDFATVQNMISICKDGHVVFECPVILDKHQQGLQHPQLGFLICNPPSRLLDYCMKFERVYSPLTILN